MPTFFEKLTSTPEGVAMAVADLRARIEERRKAAWQPEPGETVLERRMHWERFAAQRLAKIAEGEYIEDELLSQLRDDKDMSRLGREFLKAAERGNAPVVGAYIEEGFPVNYQDRQTQETALHISAGTRARKVLRVLLDCGLCNFLLRDKGGRLASELAYLFGHDPAVARLLGTKERKQAEAQGIKLTRRPQ
jgi:ankyrin repeat protein